MVNRTNIDLGDTNPQQESFKVGDVVRNANWLNWHRDTRFDTRVPLLLYLMSVASKFKQLWSYNGIPLNKETMNKYYRRRALQGEGPSTDELLARICISLPPSGDTLSLKQIQDDPSCWPDETGIVWKVDGEEVGAVYRSGNFFGLIWRTNLQLGRPYITELFRLQFDAALKDLGWMVTHTEDAYPPWLRQDLRAAIEECGYGSPYFSFAEAKAELNEIAHNNEVKNPLIVIGLSHWEELGLTGEPVHPVRCIEDPDDWQSIVGLHARYAPTHIRMELTKWWCQYAQAEYPPPQSPEITEEIFESIRSAWQRELVEPRFANLSRWAFMLNDIYMSISPTLFSVDGDRFQVYSWKSLKPLLGAAS